MEKKSSLLAILGIAAGTNAAQASYTNKLLRNHKLGSSVATYIRAGYEGKTVPKGIFREVGKGIAAPEVPIMQREAYKAGQALKAELKERGITDLTKKDMLLVRKVTEGKFNKAVEMSDKVDNPQLLDIMASKIEGNSGVPKGLLTKAISMKDTKKREALLADVESVWRKADNPLTSNIMSRATRPDEKVKALIEGVDKGSIKTNLIANAGLASAIDPTSAALNTTKLGLTSKAADSNRYLRKTKEIVQDKILVDPTKAAYKAGAEGQKTTTVQKFLNKFETNAVNPVSGQAKKLGKEFGDIMHKHNIAEPTTIRAKVDEIKRKAS